MAITPSYGWPTPDNTDLLRTGATAIRDLADAIDGTLSHDGLAGYTEQFSDLGTTSGTVNIDVSTANVFRINPNGAVTITFDGQPTDTSTVAPATLIIANSTYAITWPSGTKHPHGEPPELDGETWLSIVVTNTDAVVGLAWSGVA